MNTFISKLEEKNNLALTKNWGRTHKTTGSNVYDLFATGGACRDKSKEECIRLFSRALAEDELLAMKCLFYLRDCRGGQGERRFFRICFEWLVKNHPSIAAKNLINVAEFGRWDDLIYTTIDSDLESSMLEIISNQLYLDLHSKTPSLLGKWMPSENASSKETIAVANKIRKRLNLTHKQYRKTLSFLRSNINIVEKLMSENRWKEIEFDKIPSKAGFIYRNAFAHKDVISRKYRDFIQSDATKVNANVLYPYEIVHQYFHFVMEHYGGSPSQLERETLNKYWENLPDYFEGKDCSMLCMVDVSGSMTGLPMEVAISLGIYTAERNSGPFKDYFMTFSGEPELVKLEGQDICSKIFNMEKSDWGFNTDLVKAFREIKKIVLETGVEAEDVPKTFVIISDMQIDSACGQSGQWNGAETEMEMLRREWEADGLTLPHLVYWNVHAQKNNILDASENVSYVSGFSPIIFKTILTGKSGYDLMLETLESERYSIVK